jgi:hypothetical protein
MKALVQGTRICQVVDDDKTFEVHSDLKWVDVADGTTDFDTWIDNKVVKYVAPTPTYKEKRVDAYGSIGDQLDMQYWDAVNGTTTWKDHVAKVKSDNPKP